MSDPNSDRHDDDFHPPATSAPDPSLADLTARIRTRLETGESCLPMIEDVRLFVMARFYQVPPDVIARELAAWGLEPDYAAGLVASALATDRYDPRAEQARRMAAADDAGRPPDPALAAMCRPDPPRRGEAGSGLPDTCPTCDRVLYPIARLRPGPTLGWPARSLVLAGCAASAVFYFWGLADIRGVIRVPTWGLALVWFPVAILHAVGVGALAYRLPRVVTPRCRSCGWRGRFRLGRPSRAGVPWSET